LAAVEAIGALDAASLTREDKLRVAVVAIEALQTLLKKEGMDEVRVAAVMALGLWLSYTSKITPEAKQLYLAGAQLPNLRRRRPRLILTPPLFATGFKDVKDTTRHAYLESFIVALKSAREDWTLSSLNVISDFGTIPPPSSRNVCRSFTLTLCRLGYQLIPSSHSPRPR
jgi:hypothetical protein